MKNNNTAIEQYNNIVREFNTKAMPHAPTMAQAREIVAKLLPVIEELGAMKHGTMHGRKHVWSKAYFVDTTTRKWAKFFDNNNVATAFKEHGLCGKARPVHYSTWAWEQHVNKNASMLDNKVEIVTVENKVADKDLAKFDNESGWASQGIEMTGNEVEVTADELLAGLGLDNEDDNKVVAKADNNVSEDPWADADALLAGLENIANNKVEEQVPEQVVEEQVVVEDDNKVVGQVVPASNDNDNDIYDESALYDTLGGYEVVDEQVEEQVPEQTVVEQTVPEQTVIEQVVPHTYSMDYVTAEDIAVDEISLYARCYDNFAKQNMRPAPQQYELPTPKNESRRESLWNKLRRLIAGRPNPEMNHEMNHMAA